ncbi:YcsE-related riboflavin metabolism phosphatase [Mycoplasma elephantis]|uniref:YcsE-related riboflavin metabolism phosphatase n=1 Tax=Mycoplasma elephantis TaxID=114882 RepID=UPI0004886AA3|nr:HAD family hydrolase [Mycoplasma elephantis]
MNKIFDKIKIIAFDIDGTILTYRQHLIHDKIKKMFKTLKDNGYIIVIATGREYNTVTNIMPQITADYLIGGNGTFIYDLNKQTEVWNNYINIDSTKDIVNKLKDEMSNIFITDSKAIHAINKINTDNWFWSKYTDKIKLLDFNNVDKNTISKIEIFHDFENALNKIKKAMNEINSPLEITASWSRGTFISNKNVDKIYAIEVIAKKYGYNLENVMAFGDGANDYKMIKHAGVGVSVLGRQGQNINNNKVAKFIIAPPENFGILEFLEKNKFI